jgi:hypothetical protein
MISSMLAPASRFSKTVATGMRVPLKTQAPLTFPGMLSTDGHWDQSSADMKGLLPSHRTPARSNLKGREKTPILSVELFVSLNLDFLEFRLLCAMLRDFSLGVVYRPETALCKSPPSLFQASEPLLDCAGAAAILRGLHALSCKFSLPSAPLKQGGIGWNMSGNRFSLVGFGLGLACVSYSLARSYVKLYYRKT